MSEPILEQLLKKVDEHFAHKESVSSKILYEVVENMKAVSKDVKGLQGDLVKLDKSLTKAVDDMRYDVGLKHAKIEHKVDVNKLKVDKHDKIFWWVTTIIGGLIITAWMFTILK